MNIYLDNWLLVENWDLGYYFHWELHLYWNLDSLFNWHYVPYVDHSIHKPIYIDLNRMFFNHFYDFLNYNLWEIVRNHFNDFFSLYILSFIHLPYLFLYSENLRFDLNYFLSLLNICPKFLDLDLNHLKNRLFNKNWYFNHLGHSYYSFNYSWYNNNFLYYLFHYLNARNLNNFFNDSVPKHFYYFWYNFLHNNRDGLLDFD